MSVGLSRPRLAVVAEAKTPAQLIAEARAALAEAARLSDAAVDAIFPIANRLEEDLAAIAALPSAPVGVRERAGTLALHINREVLGIAQLLATMGGGR